MRRFLAPVLGLAFLVSACASLPMSQSSAKPDKFAWLEEVEGPKALDWVKAQNARSLAQLQADPRFEPMKAEALAIANNKDRLALGAIRGGYLYNFWQDETQVRGVWRRSPLAAYAAGAPQWETLLDIDALAKTEGKNWVYKGAECLAPDGRRCMIALSNGGKDASEYREFDVPTKSFVVGGFFVPEAKSGLAWKDADTLLVGTDWGGGAMTESGYPFIIKELKRGQQLAQAREVIRGAPKDVGVWVSDFHGEDGASALIVSQAQTFFTGSYFRVDGAKPEKLTLPARATLIGLHKGELVFSIEEDWTPPGATRGFTRGALLSMPLREATTAQPTVRLIYGPGPRESIEGASATKDSVLVSLFRNVRGNLLRMTFDGRAWLETPIALPPNGSVQLAGASVQESTAFVVFEDFLRPSTLFAIDARSGGSREVRSLKPMFDASPYETVQYEATSKDGTKVPYFVLKRKDVALNGQNPTLLYGYGGFQVSMTPSYAPNAGKLWLDRGGVYVMANIRGGGEFGPAWHQAGLKLKRQAIYDDFISVAEDLIARKITTPRRLGIMGGSNGGLLMGVMLTQRPDLFNAVVVQVPLLDMLGYADANMLAGASWVDEYGDPRLGPDGKPTHPEERAFLAQLSPYANLKKRPDFPVPFFVTSTKDDRVHPAHARKYAAKMESLGMPFYYYENIDGGHSAAANLQEAAKRRALEMTYLAKRLID
jgi:prolyl oligopeptidase